MAAAGAADGGVRSRVLLAALDRLQQLRTQSPALAATAMSAEIAPRSGPATESGQGRAEAVAQGKANLNSEGEGGSLCVHLLGADRNEGLEVEETRAIFAAAASALGVRGIKQLLLVLTGPAVTRNGTETATVASL